MTSINYWRQQMLEIKGKYTTAKVMIDDVEPECFKQITSFVNHSVFSNPISIMPDTHSGKGSVIGFCMKMTDKVIPNVVGVDIGCGVFSMNIGQKIDVSNTALELLDHRIRINIPFGNAVQEKAVVHMKNDFPWHNANVTAEKFSLAYANMFGIKPETPHYDINWFEKKVNSIGADMRRVINSIASLGGGNHFVELGQSVSTGDYWITIHSGSRNFGLKVCEFWQHKAVKSCRVDKKKIMDDEIARIRQEFTGEDVGKEIYKMKKNMSMDYTIDITGLEWLEVENAQGYLFDMIFAQKYAEFNRLKMANIIEKILGVERSETVETIHNFIDFHDFIIRKGAVRSYIGEKFVLPFNMRDGLLICEGLSNPEWLNSAPHGCGRLLSRSAAKRNLSMDKFESDMSGIFSTSVNKSTLDECPDAYKDAKVIEEAIKPTAVILDRIKPIMNLKESND
jgi:tRNA-splicing ligase RtcB (3'-phosphate/5'-hydroxy nucleic acid ligase)